MCSFIGGYFPQLTDRDSLGQLSANFQKLLQNILQTKGGDNYGIHFFLKSENYRTKVELYEDNWVSFAELLNDNIYMFGNKLYGFMAFSRLTPEMETLNSIPQPYYNKKDNASIAIHGTIPGVDVKKYNTDTDIAIDFFDYHLVKEVERLNGKISMLSFNHKDGSFRCYHNGLGLYKNKFKVGSLDLDYYTNINYDDAIPLGVGFMYGFNKGIVPSPNFGRLEAKYEYENIDTYNINIGCLYSGGLDALCSIQKQIYLEIKNIFELPQGYLHLSERLKDFDSITINFRVQLFYLDWGTRAKDQEISAVEKIVKPLSEFIEKTISYFRSSIKNDGKYSFQKDITIKHSCGYEYFNIKPMFVNILETVGIKNVRLTDKKAAGKGLKEAEEAISYVPYRNTFMLNLIAAVMEERFPNQNNKIVIGANLTEGMVYLDNSENFITQINKSIKLGGQKTMYTEVVAPYMNYTKTKMIKDILKIDWHLDLDLSFSCYFPKTNGTACGKCGSCLLRNNAILRNNTKG